MNWSQHIRRLVAGFFIVLFSAYYVNATMFWHCHIVNGVTIVHSHIHANQHHATSNGGHTGLSLTLIATLDALTCLNHAIQHFDLDGHLPLCAILFCVAVSAAAVATIRTRSLRAPPVNL